MIPTVRHSGKVKGMETAEETENQWLPEGSTQRTEAVRGSDTALGGTWQPVRLIMRLCRPTGCGAARLSPEASSGHWAKATCPRGLFTVTTCHSGVEVDVGRGAVPMGGGDQGPMGLLRAFPSACDEPETALRNKEASEMSRCEESKPLQP